MPLFLAKHGLFFGDYAAAYQYATFRWLSHMPQKGDYAPAYATFRCLCRILCSDFGVKFYHRVGAPACWIETRHYVLPWCRGALWYVLLAADCSLLVPPTAFSVLCVGVCASCFFVSFVLAGRLQMLTCFFCVLLMHIFAINE